MKKRMLVFILVAVLLALAGGMFAGSDVDSANPSGYVYSSFQRRGGEIGTLRYINSKPAYLEKLLRLVQNGSSAADWKIVKFAYGQGQNEATLAFEGTRGYAQVYEDVSWGGNTARIDWGAQIYDLRKSDNQALKNLHDKISSVRIYGGAKITLYENDKYNGRCEVVTKHEPQLSQLNDKCTSLKVEPNRLEKAIPVAALAPIMKEFDTFLTFRAPRDHEVLHPGQSYTLVWSAQNTSSSIDIYFRMVGYTFHPVIYPPRKLASVSASQGSCSVKIPTDISAGYAKIYVGPVNEEIGQVTIEIR